MSPKQRTETERQASILEFLKLGGGFFRKIHTTGIPDLTRRGGFRSNPSKGVADLIGSRLIACEACGFEVGRFVAVEVKKPGKKATKEQLDFIQGIRSAGGVACIAVDAESAIAGITAETARLRRSRRGISRRNRLSALIETLGAAGKDSKGRPEDLRAIQDAEAALRKAMDLRLIGIGDR